MNPTYENLAFEGGGVKGVAYAGALQVLDEKGILDHINRVAGTSAGAITSCLLSLRYSPAAITKTIKNMDLGSFDDSQWLPQKLHYYGLHPGNTFLKWIQKQIIDAGYGFDQNATFRDFEEAGCLDLRVFASDIYMHTVQEFSFEQTPDAIVAEAVRASMSIPLYFNAWKFTDAIPNDHLYVDGGMVYNYPLTTFDEHTPNQKSLGFRLEDTHQRKEPSKFGYGDWMHYVKNTFETLLKAQNIDFNKDPDQVERTVIVDDLGVLATDFKITSVIKDQLIESGRKATRAYLKAKFS